MPKSWSEKYFGVKPSKVKPTEKGLMYISTPPEIASVIEKVEKGKVITTKEIAERLAKKYKADYTCPLTTGIFVSIIANYSEERKAKGDKRVCPYWRVVKDKGVLYDKYLGSEAYRFR